MSADLKIVRKHTSPATLAMLGAGVGTGRLMSCLGHATKPGFATVKPQTGSVAMATVAESGKLVRQLRR